MVFITNFSKLVEKFSGTTAKKGSNYLLCASNLEREHQFSKQVKIRPKIQSTILVLMKLPSLLKV